MGNKKLSNGREFGGDEKPRERRSAEWGEE
jgi:hypothetical protein